MKQIEIPRRTAILRSFAVALVFLFAAAAQENSPAAGPAAPPADSTGTAKFPERHPRYKIGLGDVVEIDFPFVSEFNQVVTVQPDGFIGLKSVGDVYAVGLTQPELIEALKAAYSKILHDPIVTVMLKDFEKPYFTALGKVNKPGKYDLRGDTTLTQALAIAGGFDDAAKHSQVLLFHKSSDEWTEVKIINVKEMFRTGKLKEDVHMQPGDMLFVPKSFLSKIQRWIPTSSMGMYANTL
jgi:polysaccharide export outer membrane protein